MKQSQIQAIDQIRELFDYINADFLAMENNRYLIVIMYMKSIELTKNIIEKTYENRDLSDQDKIIIIRALSSLFITHMNMGHLIWQMKKTNEIKQLLSEEREYEEREYDFKSKLYRCITHMYDVESGIAETRYGLRDYDNGKYTDVEIFDRYFGYEGRGLVCDDMYIESYYKCFVREIECVNRLYWE